jgi:uncharacterized protein YpmB
MTERLKPHQLIYIAIAGVLFIAICWGILGPGCAAYQRYQKRQEAANQVKVKHIEIEEAEEAALVVRAQIKEQEAEADKRVAESIGLKKSQTEINKTLTPLYVQHEYVQAIEKAASSPSNTVEFIPVGPNGIPIVKTTP